MCVRTVFPGTSTGSVVSEVPKNCNNFTLLPYPAPLPCTLPCTLTMRGTNWRYESPAYWTCSWFVSRTVRNVSRHVTVKANVPRNFITIQYTIQALVSKNPRWKDVWKWKSARITGSLVRIQVWVSLVWKPKASSWWPGPLEPISHH